jgi:BirA family biotin operon repressor/biotin-[acetyl-CoA-carboxylase] ligase
MLRLDDSIAAQGYRLEFVETIGSTNDGLMDRAQAGDPGRLWLVAGEQTGGRGRRGRTWVSPPGNLYASLLLIDPAEAVHLPELGFVAGVAMAEAVRAVGVRKAQFALKWPNDLVSAGAKFTGLLLETRSLAGRTATVIGFGVNCAWHPDGLAYSTTDLSAVAGRAISPEIVFAALAASLHDELTAWCRGNEFEAIRQRWLGFSAGLGQPIRVETAGTTLHGIFDGIDAQGRLRLTTSVGPKTIDAGDVLLA